MDGFWKLSKKSDNRSAQDGGAQDSVEIKQLPIKAYLDQQLMPLLLEALAQLAKEKPEEPIEFVAKYLLDHNPEKNWEDCNPTVTSNKQTKT